MHEMAICERIISQIEDEQHHRGFSSVKRLRLEVGMLSCLDPDALRYALEISHARPSWTGWCWRSIDLPARPDVSNAAEKRPYPIGLIFARLAEATGSTPMAASRCA